MILLLNANVEEIDVVMVGVCIVEGGGAHRIVKVARWCPERLKFFRGVDPVMVGRRFDARGVKLCSHVNIWLYATGVGQPAEHTSCCRRWSARLST